MIPLIDLATDKKLSKVITSEIVSVLESKNYILGPKLESFEKEFARFIGTKHAVGTANGTDALRLALKALGIGHGDKVLTVALTSPFTAIAIIQEGAIPVFCDIDENTLTIDLDDAQKKIDKKTRAIIPVHIFGNPCDMEAILKFAKKHNLLVIEDACQAHGAKFGNKKIGTFGEVAAFSFYPTKNLGAAGDGGMIVTNNPKLAALIRSLRHGGQTKRFWHQYQGINSRLDEIQAAILATKLPFLEKNNHKRKNLAKRYQEKLANLPINFQKINDKAQSAWHLLVIRTNRRNSLKKFLQSKGVATDIYYPYPVHRQPAFTKYSREKLPVTEAVIRQLLAIPLYPNLTVKDQDYIIKSIREFFGK